MTTLVLLWLTLKPAMISIPGFQDHESCVVQGAVWKRLDTNRDFFCVDVEKPVILDVWPCHDGKGRGQFEPAGWPSNYLMIGEGK